jgi:hypothetical protein
MEKKKMIWIRYGDSLEAELNERVRRLRKRTY